MKPFADSEQGLVESLPLLSRLALAYAPAAIREEWLTLLALDARLATILRQAKEPMLAQLRLAWWRDRLTQPVAERPKGEPLLARLVAWPNAGAEFVPLVDGWEALLAEPPLDAAAFITFANGRIAALAALAQLLGLDVGLAQSRARRWALADLALHVQDPQEKVRARALADQAPAGRGRCPKALRPLAILEHLSVAADKRGGDLSPFTLFSALRIGLIGL
ncbi:MAG: hypothetical protein RLZZ136_658 [Pseudomonadota bacterium]